MRWLWSTLLGFAVMWVFPVVVLLMIDTSPLLCRINRKYLWKLTGEEILLQLEHRHGKHPPGIYAFNSFKCNSKLQLLIPGDERPCWSLTRKYFAYLKGEWLYIVRSDGTKEVAVAYSFADNAYHFYDPTVIWNWQDKYAVVEHNSSFGSMVLMGLGFSENEDLKLPTPGAFIVPLSKQSKSPIRLTYIFPRRLIIQWIDERRNFYDYQVGITYIHLLRFCQNFLL